MRTPSLRKAAVVALFPLALGSLAACGDNSSSTTATDPAASTSASPSDDTSSQPTSDASSDSSEPSDGSTVDPAEFLDQVKGAAKSITTAKFTMKMNFSGQAVDAQGALDMSGDSPAMQMTMGLTGQKLAMVLVDKAIYVQVPGSSSKQYYKMDLNDPNSQLGNLGDTLDNLNPSQLIDSMSADAFKKVTYVGSDSAGKHYQVLLDPSAIPMLKGLPASAGSMPKQINYDLWLDDQGRMSKFDMKLQNMADISATYSGYGDPVDIKAPDPSQVQEMPSTN